MRQASHCMLLIAFLAAMAIVPMRLSGKAISDKEVKEILSRLDDELDSRDRYILERHHRIDSLKGVERLAGADDSLRLSALLGIADNYYAFNTDSAVWFYNRGLRQARRVGDSEAALRFALRVARTIPLQLFFEQSLKIIDSVRALRVPDALQADFADAERQMHFFTANFFTQFPAVFDSITSLQREAQDRLLTLLPEDSGEYKLNLAESYFGRGNLSGAHVIADELIAETPESSPLYARASHLLADIARAREETNDRIYYLALSAIADTRCATLEVSSLQELGKTLYERGDVERSYEYLSVALSNAVDCHATLRVLQTSFTLPLIESTHREQIRNSRIRIYAVIVVLACLLIFLAVSVRIIKNRNTQLHTLTRQLTEASKTKDLYITQFLNLCSIYMDKLNQFSKTVYSKLSAGKVDDLLKLTKSGKLVEEQSKEFFEVFDDAFLHLYPTFVSDVNALLDPDKQIVLESNEKLNTDLRILALMRLGVDDSSRIAQMLNYSVNTIYTYRNKFKGRAVNRSTFESDVMAIRTISPDADITK